VKFVLESHIERPPAEVFDRMADDALRPRGRPYDSALTTCRRPERVVFEATGGAFDITAAFTITPRAEGSHVMSEFDFRPKGVMKVIFPLMQSAVRKDLAKQSQSVKRFCEQA
jgi:hypothetical protein